MSKQFKTVSEFKKILAVGDKLHCIFHMEFAGRTPEGQIIYKDKDRGVREVSIKQTNSFALKTMRTDGETQDNWCNYPKASEAKVENNVLTVFETQRDNTVLPILTYKFV